jgi:hypothetical protein
MIMSTDETIAKEWSEHFKAIGRGIKKPGAPGPKAPEPTVNTAKT